MNEKTSLLNGDASEANDEGPSGKTKPLRRVSQMALPAPYFDPKTKKLMKDPVVSPGGISYERSTWEAICKEKAEPSAPAYDNRALKQVIEETILATNNIPPQITFRRSSRKFGEKVAQRVRQSIMHVMEKSILPTEDRKTLSEAYYCPITMSLIQYPVIGPEGNTFERDAIYRWIDDNQVSPLTRAPLPSKKLLYPNLALKKLIRLETRKAWEDEETDSLREYKSSVKNQQTVDAEQPHKLTHTGPATLEEWKALRQQRKISNMEVTLNGLLYAIYLVLLFVFGVVVGLALGACALVVATLLDLFVTPCLQFICPGGLAGAKDPFGDDELPFIVQGQSYFSSEDEEDPVMDGCMGAKT